MDPCLAETPHRRLNVLTGEWILVSPHRTKRPWNGQQEKTQENVVGRHEAQCQLCPGNLRGAGMRNPDYRDVFAFENDFPALIPQTSVPSPDLAEDPFFAARPEQGTCRVLCFSPRHDLALELLAPSEIRKVVEMWMGLTVELGGKEFINHVQIFENRGIMMGCSNRHPHGQVWCNSTIPNIPALEDGKQEAYFERHRRPLLADYLDREIREGERIVFANDSFVALVPFWATWPFETLILPRTSRPDLTRLDERERDDLADALKRLGLRYDNLFETYFPYSMGIHQQPTDGRHREHWHWHIHYFPPLLRSATVKKFMVGYEMLAMPQRDLTPEQSAERLRRCSETYYLETRQPPHPQESLIAAQAQAL